MPRGENQKLKLLYLLDILNENTDDEHTITMQEIVSKLSDCSVNAERKSIYTDIEELRKYGVDIIGEKDGQSYSYHIGNREFELAELKLLVDAVQSSKFITKGKSSQLIKKIEGLTSKYHADELNHQVYVAGRVKTMNESIYYNVDLIHTAIADNVKIRFQYFMWDENKKQVLRRDGAYYSVSPWGLTWDDENYYLIGYDDDKKGIRHFRVDKMKKITLTDEKRVGKSSFKSMDMAAYSKNRFGMFDGKETEVKLLCRNDMAGVIIDRFGKNTPFIKQDDEYFVAYVSVAVSIQFLGWVMSLGEGVKIIGPDEVVGQMRNEVERLKNTYLDN
ncbi:MAG: WYL domain-containing protein [Lachnospiraceae bacterium]|nr:WYL domain-containing protein [Lachnospiraceae bacterium]